MINRKTKTDIKLCAVSILSNPPAPHFFEFYQLLLITEHRTIMDTLSQQGIIFTHGHMQCFYFIAAANQDDKGVQRKTSGVRKKI